jgi:hypothetical protein
MLELRLKQKFSKFFIYRNEASYFIICCNRNKQMVKIMTLSRLTPSLDLTILQGFYSLVDALRIVAKSLAPNPFVDMASVRPSELLLKHFVAKSYGILGFPRFLDGHYLYFITKREKICSLFGATVYRVVEAKLEMLLSQDQSCLYKISSAKSAEIKYLEYFNYMDYTNFYFSYELDLTNSMQKLFEGLVSGARPLQESRYIWNTAILHTYFGKVDGDEFILPVIQGYIDSINIRLGLKDLKLGVISRRCAKKITVQCRRAILAERHKRRRRGR